MKSKVILIFMILFCVGCQKKVSEIPSDFSIGVIETKESKKESYITFYDSSLNTFGTKRYQYGSLSSHFNDPIYLNDGIYFIPRGLMKSFNEKMIIRLNRENQEFTDFPINRTNIVCATADKNYVYAGSNLNLDSYVTRLNKKTNEVQEIILKDGFVSFMIPYNKKLIVVTDYFVPGEHDRSEMTLYDENLNLVRRVNLSEYGSGYFKAKIYQDKLYIPNENNSNDEDDNKLLVVDLKTYDLRTIELPEKRPNDIVEYNGSLIISHSSTVQADGSKISVYDVETQTITNYDLGYTILKMDILDNKLVILTDDDQLITFDIDKQFKKKIK